MKRRERAPRPVRVPRLRRHDWQVQVNSPTIRQPYLLNSGRIPNLKSAKHGMSGEHHGDCYSSPMTGNLTFGEWLDDQLRSRGWSQAEFGDSVGVVRQTVSGWVNDLQRPRRRLLTSMARVLDLDVDEVLARAGKPPVSADYRLSTTQFPRIERKTSKYRDDPFVRFMLEHSTVLTDEQRDLIMQVVLQMEKGNES